MPNTIQNVPTTVSINSNVDNSKKVVSTDGVNHEKHSNYFNSKTIFASLSGLAVIGAGIFAIKTNKKPKTNSINYDMIKNNITTVKEQIQNLKTLLKDTYLNKKNRIILNLNNFGEFDYIMPFKSRVELRKYVKTYTEQYNQVSAKSSAIIEETQLKIRDKNLALGEDPVWNELLKMRKNLLRTIKSGKSPEQIKIANDKIAMINDLLINRVYPEEQETFKILYGLEDSQVLSIVRKKFHNYDSFINEYNSLEKNNIPFSYVDTSRRFSHKNKLSLSDIFPEETEIIKVNTEAIEEITRKLNFAKNLSQKYTTKLKELAESFRSSESMDEYKLLITKLNSLQAKLKNAA